MTYTIKSAELILSGLVELSLNQRNKYANDIKKDLEKALDEVLEEEHIVKYSHADIGMGASTEALLFAIPAIVYTLFLQGKRIEDNIDAWTRLYRKIKKLILREKQNYGIYVSLPVALCFVLTLFEDDVDELKSVEFIDYSETPIGVAFGVDGEFSINPERVYTFIALINGVTLHFVGLRSNTDIIYHGKIDANDYYI